MAATLAGAEVGESSGGGENGRRWEDLNRDLVVTIFQKLEIADLIAGVPFACSSWRDAARDPTCWRVLDFRDWDAISLRLGCHREGPVDFVDLLNFSIARSEEIDSVVFPYFADDIYLLYVADRSPELLYFSLQNPEVSEERFCEAIGQFMFLKGMAVDESLICHEVLLHVQQCCMYFTELKVFADTVDVDLVSVICDCLPSLRKLEMMNCRMSRKAILTILDRLKELEYLDISGYENSGITDVVLEKASRLKVFHWDSKFQEGEFEYCSYCERDWLQDPCSCELDQKVVEWLAALP